ncbi:MAG: hypothetical protein WAW61_18685 [Methylococcaceae bacterium]
MDIQIQVKGVDELVRNLRDLGVNRIPNYVARALTGIADQAQVAMEKNMRSMLTVRGTWATRGYKYSVKRIAANKKNLEAEVYTEAPWLFEQETKTVLTPRKAGLLATPTRWVRPSRLNEEVIKKALRPRSLKRTFKVTSRYGNEVIYQRSGTGRLSTIVPMYVLRHQTPEPQRIHLVDTATETINKVSGPVLEGMIRQAIQENP